MEAVLWIARTGAPVIPPFVGLFETRITRPFGTGSFSTRARFDDADVGVNVDLLAGTATRESGFSVSVSDAIVAPLGLQGDDTPTAEEFVEQAAAGNLYFNIHTADFPAGEIRGQLLVESDVTSPSGVRTLTLTGDLDASQEPGPTSDSDATGTGTVVITVDGDIITYSSELSVEGLAESDLLTPGAGAVSAIHLHNAPAGINGPVAQDTLVDAGATLDANVASGVSGLDVIDNVTETDTLESIENIVGSNDGDIISGDGQADVLDGGEGIDTNSFQGIGADVTADLAAGTAQYGNVFETFVNFENLDGSANNDQLFGDANANVLTGNDGDDSLSGREGDNTLEGGAGADVFVFAENSGVDTITDFELGIDLIDLTEVGIEQLNIAQDGDDVMIDLGEGNSIILQDILASSLSEDDILL